MTVGIPRERLWQAWLVFERVHLPVLTWRTQRSYRACVRRAIEDLPELLQLEALLVWHRVRLLTEKKLSLGYANMCVHVLRVVTRRAGRVTGDVELAALVEQLQLVREPVRASRCPPADLMARVLEVVRNPAERAFLLLAGLAGLRLGELLGLQPEDYDRELGVLQVLRQRRQAWRKNRRPHSVTINAPELRAAIVWTLENRERIRSKMGFHRGSSDGFIFPWSTKYVYHFVQRLRKRLGEDVARYLPRRCGLHVFRHWGASTLARCGASTIEVQAWLGDADPAMACRYVDLVRGRTASSVAILAARWRESERARAPSSRRRKPRRKSKLARRTDRTPCGEPAQLEDGPRR